MHHLSTATPAHKLSGSVVSTWNFDDTNEAVHANIGADVNTFYYRMCTECTCANAIAEWELLTAFLLSVSLACVLFAGVVPIGRLQLGACVLFLTIGK